MGSTSPDLLPWPEYADEAAVPQDMQEMAAAVQVALDKRANVTLTSAALAVSSGWTGNAANVVRMGKIVVCGGTFIRPTAALSVTDNSEYQIATVPAGYRPPQIMRCASAWKAFDGSKAQTSTLQVVVDTDGSVKFTATYTGSIRAGGDYISTAGLVWWVA